eukprot:NODE_12510_length_1221_cov_2.823583.p8 GENE.NODE_12510_length_1221_cov_2.823583~~NODE_12510_length_1221_cov_2.823583.p8  ORF type:complete len:61 (-),score=8.42 NODE_12510_length_1221_cov_2.823583:779-961(-)
MDRSPRLPATFGEGGRHHPVPTLRRTMCWRLLCSWTEYSTEIPMHVQVADADADDPTTAV